MWDRLEVYPGPNERARGMKTQGRRCAGALVKHPRRKEKIKKQELRLVFLSPGVVLAARRPGSVFSTFEH